MIKSAINLIVEIPRRCIVDGDDNGDSFLLDHQKTENRSVEVNWLDLPDHILSLIADKLILQKDLISFGAVCRPWQSSYADIVRRRSHRLPLLLLSTEDYQDDQTQTRSFYNLKDQTVYDAQVPVPHNMHCPGSSHGWLFIVCPKTFQVRLFNPFLSSNNEILLPPLTTFQYKNKCIKYIHAGLLEKAVLSTNPALDPNNNYVIMAIYSSSSALAFYRPGDNTWTSLDSQYNNIVDVIYYRDQFYVINRLGVVFSFDFNHQETPKISTIALHPPEAIVDKRYLVESSGDLLQVVRYIDYKEQAGSYDFEQAESFDFEAPTYYCNDGFDVFKLDAIEQMWVYLDDNLGGRILFLGNNSSLSVSASDFPECKSNSIYFTDDYYNGCDENEENGIGGHDMGVYDLEKYTIEPHYPIANDVARIYPRPVWIEPPA